MTRDGTCRGMSITNVCSRRVVHVGLVLLGPMHGFACPSVTADEEVLSERCQGSAAAWLIACFHMQVESHPSSDEEHWQAQQL